MGTLDSNMITLAGMVGIISTWTPPNLHFRVRVSNYLIFRVRFNESMNECLMTPQLKI